MVRLLQTIKIPTNQLSQFGFKNEQGIYCAIIINGDECEIKIYKKVEN